MPELIKITTTVPESHADVVRRAIGDAGGGRIGNYSYCSFSTKGTGRFKPAPGAHPAIGEVGKIEEITEERIEVTCEKTQLNRIVSAIKSVHPYEKAVIDVYPLLDLGGV